MSSKDENKDENENMLLEYMEDVDDKLLKEYSKGKNLNFYKRILLCNKSRR